MKLITTYIPVPKSYHIDRSQLGAHFLLFFYPRLTIPSIFSFRMLWRCMVPWIALHLVWVPFNQILCAVVGKVTVFKACARIIWLPYLSFIAAVAFFIWSINQSGAINYFLRPVQTIYSKYTGVTPLLVVKHEVDTTPITMVTRSGKMLGGRHGNAVRLTRRGTVYNTC